MKKYYHLLLIIISIYMFLINETFAQWEQIPQLDGHVIYCMLGINDNTIFVGGNGGLLIRSTNSGTTWTDVMGNGFWVDTVLSLGEGLGYVFAGTNGAGGLFRSSDLGETWSLANTGLTSSTKVNAFTFADSVLFAATDIGVYSSLDSGKTWEADTVGLGIDQFPDGWGTTGIVSVGTELYTIKFSGGTVYGSSLDTILWHQVSTNYYNQGFGITAIDTNIFIATMKGIYVYAGGTTWLPRNNGLPVNDTTWLNSCILTTEDTLLFAYILPSSQPQAVYVSSNLGENWKRIDDSVSSMTSITAIAVNEDYFFAGTQSGGWRIPIEDLITSIDRNNYQSPSGFSLSQNYPNPFNPSTVISYQLPVGGHVSLKIFDILGNEIKTLVNQNQPAGSYKIKFSAKGGSASGGDGYELPSGIYLYELSAGDFHQAKKMILLK